MGEKYICERCAADPQPEWYGSPRNCAFTPEGAFTDDNWNCATLIEVLRRRRDFDGDIHGDDERIELTDVPREDDEVTNDGWLVTSRYKSRGRTSSAVWVGDFFPPRPFTRDVAERIIRYREADRG